MLKLPAMLSFEPASRATYPPEVLSDMSWVLPVLPLVVMSLVYMVLRRMHRSGWIQSTPVRFGAGLRHALMAFGTILQPNVPGPDDRPDCIEVRQRDDAGGKPHPDRAAVLFEDGRWTPDGLRTPLDVG